MKVIIKSSCKVPIITLFLFLSCSPQLLFGQKNNAIRSIENQVIAEWLIQIDESDSIQEIVKSVGAKSYQHLSIGQLKGFYILTFDHETLKKERVDKTLKAHKRIKWSNPNEVQKGVPKSLNDPKLNEQWHIKNTGQNGGTVGADANVTEAWDIGYTGKDVQICVIDDGVQSNHPDLSSRFMSSLSTDINTPSNGSDPIPANGDNHGTAVAGVACASGDNGIGVSGVAYEANLSGIRLLSGTYFLSDVVNALTFKMDSNHIYNNSWGPFDDGVYHSLSEITKMGLKEGASNGRNGLGSIYTWAAGNGRANNDNSNYDAYVNSIYTIGVGAHTNLGGIASYSEPGASMLISAPSNGGTLGITTTDLVGNQGYSSSDYTSNFGGTSSATPLVSGLIALMLEANPTLSWRDVQHILVEEAIKIDPTNHDWSLNGANHNINHNYGFGGVDAAALATTAKDWISVPESISDTSALILVNKAIPDGAGKSIYGMAIDTSVIVNADIVIEHVELVINTDHTYWEDLRIKLISPSGTESLLAEQRLVDSGSDIDTWTFMTVRNWGESAMGAWQVAIDDGYSADTGIWESFQLIVHGTPASCPVTQRFLENDNISSETHQAIQFVRAAGIVSNGSDVKFSAAGSIQLSAGFEIEAGGSFEATIGACND